MFLIDECDRSPFIVAKPFSDTNDQQLQTYTQAELDEPPLQNMGSVPTV